MAEKMTGEATSKEKSEIESGPTSIQTLLTILNGSSARTTDTWNALRQNANNHTQLLLLYDTLNTQRKKTLEFRTIVARQGSHANLHGELLTLAERSIVEIIHLLETSNQQNEKLLEMLKSAHETETSYSKISERHSSSGS